MTLAVPRLPRIRIGDADVTGIAQETLREVSDDDIPGLAAEMAYHSILAIFPFLLFLAGVAAFAGRTYGSENLTERVVDRAAKVMPEDAVSVIESFMSEIATSDGTGAIVFGLVASVWAASSAIGSAMKALNRAYDVKEDRGFVRRKIVALGLTIGFTGMLLVAASMLASGGLIAGGIGGALGWREEFSSAWRWLTIPFSLGLVVLAVTLLYWLAPNTGHQFRWITPGALVFAVGWISASVAFALYVGQFGSYNRTYGSIGAVIILIVWLYWTNLILLVGGELNAVLARRHDPEYKAEEGAKPQESGSKANPAS